MVYLKREKMRVRLPVPHQEHGTISLIYNSCKELPIFLLFHCKNLQNFYKKNPKVELSK